MIHLRCCLLGLLLLVLPTRALPTSFYHDRQHTLQEDYYVDINQFSQFFGSHLSFEHLDGTVLTLSKSISQHFQSLVQVTTQPIGLNDDSFVDVDLLKGQLQGAVGCMYRYILQIISPPNTHFFFFIAIAFIEDSLPHIWNTRASSIDKSLLAAFIQDATVNYCLPSEDVVLNTCIENHSSLIVSHVDHYIQNHLKDILRIIVMEDLPPLFQTTQSHVNGILAHFHHYLLHSNRNAVKPTNPIVIHQTFENSDELLAYLETAVQQHHNQPFSLQDSPLQKFIALSRVD